MAQPDTAQSQPNRDRYESPLVSRYTSPEMQKLFSDNTKFSTWRRLWIALAKAQKQLGLDITSEQIEQMEANRNNIDYERAAAYEAEFKHDVMAHIKTFGDACLLAAPIIHLGATSCYVTDNTDLLIMRKGLGILEEKLAGVIRLLSDFAEQHKALPCLGFTHLMPAQPVTVGKRACMWLEDLLVDLSEIQRVMNKMRFLGSRGATGTQASFLSLFEGDEDKVEEMNKLIADEFRFNHTFTITGQTYPRKQDTLVLNTLAGLAESIHKINMDLRLLQSKKEIEEPFKEKQVGSSAMPYKRNPMTLERGCSLARHVTTLRNEAAMTHMTQMFERTLDDSAGRRIYLPEAFLTADAILRIGAAVYGGLVVYPRVIAKHLDEELPFMATEEILMAMVNNHGGNRQTLHEKLRRHSQAAGDVVKKEGGANDLVQRIQNDPDFAPIHDALPEILNPQNFVRGVPQTVTRFLEGKVAKALRPFALVETTPVDLKV